MTFNPYWAAATLIQNPVPAVDPSLPTVISSYSPYNQATSYGAYVAPPTMYIDSVVRVGSSAVDVTYATPGYISASPIVGAIYNPLVSIVEPLVPPASAVILAQQPDLHVAQPLDYSYGYSRKRRSGFRPTSQYCDICKVTCNSKASVQSHFSGSLHKRKAALLTRETSESCDPDWKCELCAVNCTSNDSFKSHISGSRHLKKVDECRRLNQFVDLRMIPSVNTLHPGASSLIGESLIIKKVTEHGLSFRCTLCDCEVIDENSRLLHLKGRRHRLAYKNKYDNDLHVEMQPSKRIKHCVFEAKKRVTKKERKKSKFESEFKVHKFLRFKLLNLFQSQRGLPLNVCENYI